LSTNLPVQLTPFIGRDAELARISKAIGEHREVTMTGVGGVGKTRLALQVAAEVTTTYRDGVWISELAPADDEESMLTNVAATSGVQLRAGSPLAESILEAVHTRQLLWLVDNCEHLIEPAAQLVDRVLRTAPGITILATSREALDVDGEHVVGIRPMAVT